VSILAERPILTDAGEVTAEQAKEHAESEFQMQLLQKIEELTLYIIKQEDKISQQEKRIQELENILSK